MPVRKTKEQFIEKSIEIHGDKYDYSKVDYKNANTKVIIICQNHGEFSQLPQSHTFGYGCRLCGRESQSNTMKKDTNHFLEKARLKHNDIYDYSKVEYVDSKSKVEIVCREHGPFFQTPHAHLSGTNCPKCDYLKRIGSKVVLEDFIKRVETIHNYTYTYEKTEYVKGNVKTTITCKIHGDFMQTPSNHLRGKGCKKCAQEMGTYTRSGYIEIAKGRKPSLYIVKFKNENEEFYKIGKTLAGLKTRFAGYKYEYKEIKLHQGDAGYIYDLEVELHRMFKTYKYKPLLNFSGYTECYNLSLPILKIIMYLNKRETVDKDLYKTYKDQFIQANQKE